MQNITRILLGFLSFFAATPSLANNKILICTDTNFWYPFTYLKDKEPAGLHIDIIRTALQSLGYEAQFKATSWKQCLSDAEEGLVDAVATTSYRDDRAAYLNYPEGAAVDKKSPWRVSQVGYVLVTSSLDKQGKKNTYRFNGNFKKVPEPVRVPIHYSVAHDLKKEGLKVREGKESLYNFQQLAQTRTGSVVDIEDVALYFKAQPQFADKLTIQKRRLNYKSYFLAFSKSGSVKRDESEIIWTKIANIRDNPKQIADFLKKY
ncbi:MAG TPA: transporter substrate-binding domain-containing protein [Gammaproteobacteria bacterium]|nr:transporter substrate-binding domain-containing protein [Gammaproteobacteria bacterium]